MTRKWVDHRAQEAEPDRMDGPVCVQGGLTRGLVHERAAGLSPAGESGSATQWRLTLYCLLAVFAFFNARLANPAFKSFYSQQNLCKKNPNKTS